MLVLGLHAISSRAEDTETDVPALLDELQALADAVVAMEELSANANLGLAARVTLETSHCRQLLLEHQVTDVATDLAMIRTVVLIQELHDALSTTNKER